MKQNEMNEIEGQYTCIGEKKIRWPLPRQEEKEGKIASEELANDEEKVREAHGDLSDRTALENCGFELACAISRCLLRPFVCDAKR